MSGEWRVDKHVKQFLGEWKCMLRGRKQHEDILLQLNLLKYFEVVNWIEATEYIDLMFFSTVHHSIGLFLQPTLMHSSITTCMSHYYPRHVSGP